MSETETDSEKIIKKKIKGKKIKGKKLKIRKKDKDDVLNKMLSQVNEEEKEEDKQEEETEEETEEEEENETSNIIQMMNKIENNKQSSYNYQKRGGSRNFNYRQKYPYYSPNVLVNVPYRFIDKIIAFINAMMNEEKRQKMNNY